MLKPQYGTILFRINHLGIKQQLEYYWSNFFLEGINNPSHEHSLYLSIRITFWGLRDELVTVPRYLWLISYQNKR